MRALFAVVGMLAIAPAWAATQEVESVTVGFHGPGGKPKVVKEVGDLDGRKATDERLLTLAPYDQLFLQIEGAGKFTGKTVMMDAKWIETKTHTEGFIITTEVREHIPHPVENNPPTTLEVGRNVRVKVFAKHPGGAEELALVLDPKNPSGYFRADEKVDLRVEIETPPGSVAWEDRGADDREKAEYEDWLRELKRHHKDVKRGDVKVVKGDLDRLRVKVICRR